MNNLGSSLNHQLHHNTSSSAQASFELNPTIQCNDLKAFERRLMETILQQRPRERLWRIMLAISLLLTLICSYFWLHDSMNTDATLIDSLVTHYMFSVNCLVLIFLFVLGAHRRVIQSNIIVNRIRQVLYDFAITCDDSGKLIIKQNYSRIASNTMNLQSPTIPTSQISQQQTPINNNFSSNLLARRNYPY
ncbi:Nuclear envelope phosphatase-regulatory subunit 1, partial [Blomia tropicalis]